MSDTTEKQKSRSHLKFSDVRRFLDTKSPNSDCQSCGTNNWVAQYGRLANEADVVYSAHVLVMGVPFDTNKKQSLAVAPTMPFGRAIVPLLCSNCGFYRIFDLMTISKWLDENPATEIADE